MFTNLIESSSHAHDFKRRGSFFLFTTVTYLLLFAIAGVASIYAYDARLEDQNLEEIVMLSPVDLPAPTVAPAHNDGPQRTNVMRNEIPAIEVGTPPPPAVEKPKPQIIHKSVLLNGEALSLPKPPYPAIAKQLRIQGPVNVQVVISETGKVISAKAVSGNPALVTAAQQAALQARFSPTMLGEQPVKVSGIITYNFVLQ